MIFPVYVFTSDKYMHALRPFSYLFNKYWSTDQRVIVGGFSYPNFQLPRNFQFYSIGKMEDYPVDKWSDAIIEFLHHFKDPIFCLMLEDYWITEDVNIEVVSMLSDYMNQFKGTIKIDLYTDRRYAGGVKDYGNCGYIPLVKSDPGSAYHMSLMCGLWNRKNILKVLVPNETPWQVEISGTTRLSSFGDDLTVIGTKSWDDSNEKLCPVRHTLAFRGGDSGKLLLDELSDSDVTELKKLELI